MPRSIGGIQPLPVAAMRVQAIDGLIESRLEFPFGAEGFRGRNRVTSAPAPILGCHDGQQFLAERLVLAQVIEHFGGGLAVHQQRLADRSHAVMIQKFFDIGRTQGLAFGNQQQAARRVNALG